MKPIALKRTVLLLALIAPVPPLAAQEGVTLREAIGRALSQNHLLKAASARQGGAGAAVAAAGTRYLPRIYLDSGATISDTPSAVFMMKLDEGRISPASDFSPEALNHPAPRGDFRSAVTLHQPILDLSIGKGISLAQKDAEMAELSLQRHREGIAFTVYEGYLEVRRARAMERVAEQGVLDAREHVRVAAVRHANGNGLKSDELRAATELAEAQQRMIGARHDLLLAKLRLNLVVGGKVGEALEIEGDFPLPDPALSREELIRLALLNRPDLREAASGVEKGELALQQARESYLPTVYAGASYQINDRDHPFGVDNDSWSAGMTLRWEAFDGTRRSHEVRRARFSREGSAAMLENLRREIALQVTESLLRREEALLKLVSARAALAAAEEGMRLVTRRFENGLSAMVELVDAEAALDRARGTVVEVENGCLKATAQVYKSAGLFLQEVSR